MALSLAGSTAVGNGNGTSVVTNVPTGTVNGDLLIWAIGITNLTANATPSGWNVWHVQTTTACQVNVYWRVAASEPASYTATIATGRFVHTMLAVRGADLTTPEDVASAGTAGTTATTASAVTPVTAGSWVLSVAVAQTASGVTPGNYTSGNLDAVVQTGFSNVGANTNAAIGVGYEAWGSGAFTPTWTAGSATARTIGVSSVIRPAIPPRRQPLALRQTVSRSVVI